MELLWLQLFDFAMMNHYTFIYVHLLILACLCYVITVGVRVQINKLEKSKLIFWRVSIVWKILQEAVDNSDSTTTYIDKIKISLFVISIVNKGKLHSRWKDLSLIRCKGIANCVVLHQPNFRFLIRHIACGGSRGEPLEHIPPPLTQKNATKKHINPWRRFLKIFLGIIISFFWADDYWCHCVVNIWVLISTKS